MKQTEMKHKDFYETPTILDIQPVSPAIQCQGLSNDPIGQGNEEGDD